MGDWKHSSILCGWVKAPGDRRFYWVVFGVPSGWLNDGWDTSFKAVVDDFGTLVKV